MFEQLFERPHAVTRHCTGPLTKEREEYLRHLANQGMARMTVRSAAEYLLIVVRCLRLEHRPGEIISVAEIARAAGRWGRERASSCSRRRFLRFATQWLEFLGRLQRISVPPAPGAEQIRAYADYMRRERALSPRTISYRCWTIQGVLRRLHRARRSLRDITIDDIDRLLADRVERHGDARVTVQTYACTLRSFFRFAEARGWCRGGLAAAIKGPRVFSQEPLPVGPSWVDVERLLAMTNGDSPTDIRDRAILMLLVSYGFRAGEVIWLRLEDFDWVREELSLSRTKSSRAQTYPLSRPVGEAVLRYLKEVRPRSAHREVFLTRRAPFRPLRAGLWRIVAQRLRHLGVAIPHSGPHALRHACATRLLSKGLSLKEIGDHLGHRRPDTTRIYAKVDLVGLRRVADFDLGDLR
jgi:integrase/recombinase XerD